MVLSEEENKTDALFDEINNNPRVNEFFQRRIQNLEQVIAKAKDKLALFNEVKPKLKEHLSFHNNFKDPKENKDSELERHMTETKKAIQEEIKYISSIGIPF